MPHSLVARQILKDEAPHLLPTPLEELQWLMEEIFEDLDVTSQLMGDESDNLLERQADELIWSLAVLWKDPLTGDPLHVDSFLADLGIKDEIQERLNEL